MAEIKINKLLTRKHFNFISPVEIHSMEDIIVSFYFGLQIVMVETWYNKNPLFFFNSVFCLI